MKTTRTQLADFSQIRLGDGALLSPQVMLGFNFMTYAYIERQVAIPSTARRPSSPIIFRIPTAPRKSTGAGIPTIFSPVASMCSTTSFTPTPWVCGYTNHPVDVTVGRTRIVCNPRGYLSFLDERNNGLRWDLEIDTEDLP